MLLPPVPGLWQLAVVKHEVSVARGRLRRILPLASGWVLASRRATALRAKEAGQLLLAKAAVRLPASTALWVELLAIGRQRAECPIGPMPLLLEVAARPSRRRMPIPCLCPCRMSLCPTERLLCPFLFPKAYLHLFLCLYREVGWHWLCLRPWKCRLAYRGRIHYRSCILAPSGLDRPLAVTGTGAQDEPGRGSCNMPWVLFPPWPCPCPCLARKRPVPTSPPGLLGHKADTPMDLARMPTGPVSLRAPEARDARHILRNLLRKCLVVAVE